jgi:hypothetical protein
VTLHRGCPCQLRPHLGRGKTREGHLLGDIVVPPRGEDGWTEEIRLMWGHFLFRTDGMLHAVDQAALNLPHLLAFSDKLLFVEGHARRSCWLKSSMHTYNSICQEFKNLKVCNLV